MKKIRIFAVFLVLQTLFLTAIPTAYAQSDQDRLQQLQQEQQDLQNKINQSKSTENTLSGQINSMDSKIQATQAQITATQQKITNLEDQIQVLTSKITNVEDSLSNLQQTLLTRIRATYALGEPTETDLFLSNQGFDQALTSYHYLQILQQNDIKLLAQMQSTKQNYGDQKTSLVDTQTQLQQAKADLDKQTAELAQQKADKQKLLTSTQNDEKRYAQQLAASRAESAAIEEAIANSGNLVNGTFVHKGDVIALMGNSGAPSCSTGAHLHFEVHINGRMVDPATYLNDAHPQWDNSPDSPFGFSGQSDWPLPDPVITQGYGMTYWARTGFYGGGPHTGIDMISHTSIAIRAVADGTLYKASEKCGSSILKYAVLDQGNGVKSYYLHIQ